jgi:GNAT superfamily N-acetyltransferase
MEMLFSPSTVEVWVEQSQSMFEQKVSFENYVNANTFSSIQYIDNEDSEKQKIKVYSIQILPTEIAWAAVYYISPEIIRIRGLFVKAEFRNQGVMSFLIDQIKALHAGKARRIVSFAKESSVAFHEKNQFRIEPKFVPRKAIVICPETHKPIYQDSEKIRLMCFDYKS